MSSKVVENPIRIAAVDVDGTLEENVAQSDLAVDSGTETLDTACVSCTASSDSEVSPTKYSDSASSDYKSDSIDLDFLDNSPSKTISESLPSKNCGSPLPTEHSLFKNNYIDLITRDNTLNVDNTESLTKTIKNTKFNAENSISTDNVVGYSTTENVIHNNLVPDIDALKTAMKPKEDCIQFENSNLVHVIDVTDGKDALHNVTELKENNSSEDNNPKDIEKEITSIEHKNSIEQHQIYNNNFAKDVVITLGASIEVPSSKHDQNFIVNEGINSKEEKESNEVNNFIDNTNVELCKDFEISTEALAKAALNKTDENINMSEENISNNKVISKMDFNVPSKNLTMSTTSLNDQVQRNCINDTKSPYSRSAENISTMDDNAPSSTDSSTKDLNTEQILTDFTNQKNKVKGTQKIVAEIPNASTDLKYARIPKELLSQDLGSIAKSVHGIFSSVSGSLKNAYNSQRPAVKLPIKNIMPVKPNANVINEIFEDNAPETNISVIDNVDTETDKVNIKEVASPSSADDETKKDLMKLQIESLERVLAEQRRENSALRECVKQRVDELQAKDHTFKEMEAKVDLMSKRAEQAQKEKDAAVMRYASVECQAIEARRAADAAARAEKAAVAEKDLLSGKLRSARDERERICQMYDDKCHELKNSEAEVHKLREELRELDGRLKWTQSKLRVEMDAYKESAERVEKLTNQVSELEAAKETAAVNATDSAKAKQLEAELKESQAALILCRHEKEELEKRWAQTAQQLESCKKERDVAKEGLVVLKAEVEQLQESNLRLEQEAAELAPLRARAALADALAARLRRESERATQAEEALSRECGRADTCARREAAALEHAAALTAQHVAQRAHAEETHAKAQALAVDNASLRERITSLEEECSRLKTALEEETERRNKENRVLARKVAELTEEAADANKKLEWEKGENAVLKKKHSSAIKELNRELQRAMKRVEQLEAKLPQPNTSEGPSTRTGSITSLSSSESAHEERLHNGHADAVPDVQGEAVGTAGAVGAVPSRQALIERIVALQRAAARRAERCEFLEEHARQLTGELRARGRLLRRLLPALPAAALAPDRADRHKKEIANLGGSAMGAIWGGDSDGITPELALEVATRLQAVLEDTLLKNITLKENIDTLGEEIARLRKQASSSNESK